MCIAIAGLEAKSDCKVSSISRFSRFVSVCFSSVQSEICRLSLLEGLDRRMLSERARNFAFDVTELLYENPAPAPPTVQCAFIRVRMLQYSILPEESFCLFQGLERKSYCPVLYLFSFARVRGFRGNGSRDV